MGLGPAGRRPWGAAGRRAGEGGGGGPARREGVVGGFLTGVS